MSDNPGRPHCLPGCGRLDGHDGRDPGACMKDGAVLVSDAEFRERFEMARWQCLHGHPEGCTYGGMTPGGGYWLAVAECARDHGEACAVCGGEPDACFGGWAGEPGGDIWGVVLCDPCRARQIALEPGKWRDPAGETPAETRSSGIACPSCGTGMTDLPRGHALVLYGDRLSAARAECAAGEPVELTGAPFTVVHAASNVAVWDEYRRHLDAVVRQEAGTGPANFTGLLGTLRGEAP